MAEKVYTSTQPSALSTQPLNILFVLKCNVSRRIFWFTAENAEAAGESKILAF